MITSNTVDIKVLTGAQITLRTLKSLGVDTVFGYPGSAVLALYDELYKQNDIKHYLVRHEQSAVHAAEGYARVSGKCGVVFVTSGAGAANTVSGIANAYMDGYPLIIITGQVSKDLIGTGAFQEIDILDITKNCTKSGYSVTGIDTLQSTLKDAYYCAMSGKKGPVVIDISKNVFEEKCRLQAEFSYVEGNYNIKDEVLTNILQEIKNAKSPVVVAGGGVVHSDSYKELREVISLLKIPVVTTMMGIGTISAENKYYAGMIGSFGDVSANDIVRKSDLILSLGARFNDKIRSAFKNGELSKKIIQIDINKNEISKVFPAYISVVADIKNFLIKFTELIKKDNYDYRDIDLSAIINNKNNKFSSGKLSLSDVVNEIYEVTKDFEPVVTTEVGQHQISVIKNYKFSKPRHLLTSGGTGTMGFGLPAAIGACIASPKQPVICIAGDGSFQMNEQELATIRDYNLPVKIFIMNNGYLGMIRQLQQYSYESRYSQTKILNPDFIKLAEAYNIPAVRVEDKNNIKSALERAFAANTPYVIDFVLDPLETV